MQPLSKQDVNTIFGLVSNSISSTNGKAGVLLQDMKPLDHEYDSLTWRYRLDGYMHGLAASDLLDESAKNTITTKLLGIKPVEGEKRPGREFHYSIDIYTDQEKRYSFEVPASNPTDAYFQLTKRIAYKSIPDIERVDVFPGKRLERAGTAPLKTFEKGELIFVSLV